MGMNLYDFSANGVHARFDVRTRSYTTLNIAQFWTWCLMFKLLVWKEFHRRTCMLMLAKVSGDRQWKPFIVIIILRPFEDDLSDRHMSFISIAENTGDLEGFLNPPKIHIVQYLLSELSPPSGSFYTSVTWTQSLLVFWILHLWNLNPVSLDPSTTHLNPVSLGVNSLLLLDPSTPL